MLKRVVSDRSVRVKILAVALTLAMLTAVVSALAISRLGAVYQVTDDIVTENVKPLTELAKVQTGVKQARVDIRQLALSVTPDARDEAMKAVAADDDALDAALAQYAPRAADPGAMQSFRTTWGEWRQGRDSRLVAVARAGDLKSFAKISEELMALSTKASAFLDTASAAEAAQADRNAAAAKSTYDSARTLILLIAIVGLVLAMTGAEYIARRVVVPLRGVAAVLTRVA